MPEQDGSANMKSDGFGRWMTALLVVYGLCVAAVLSGCFTHPGTEAETELTVIQSVIENLPEYREVIESWGYQVLVLPQDAEAVGFSFLYYYDDSDTVLILKAPDGGMYCFYYGFDQYASKKICPAQIQEQHSGRYIDVLKTVNLSIAKRNRHQAPYQENTCKPGTRNYYDMDVGIDIDLFSAEDGKQLFGGGDGLYFTDYCSNNFDDCQWFGHSLHHSAEWINEQADSHIKQEYSAEELLAFYRQGLALQEKLTELYHNAKSGAAQPVGYVAPDFVVFFRAYP